MREHTRPACRGGRLIRQKENVRRDPFVDALKARADIRVVEVTTQNRDCLAEEVAAQVMSEL